MPKSVRFCTFCDATPSIHGPECSESSRPDLTDRDIEIWDPGLLSPIRGLNSGPGTLPHQFPSYFFFVFQYPGTFPLADSHYGMSELKIPLRTLGLDPDFHAFFTARGDDVQIADQKSCKF